MTVGLKLGEVTGREKKHFMKKRFEDSLTKFTADLMFPQFKMR